MVDIARRTFLKFLGTGIAATALPDVSIFVAKSEVAGVVESLGLVRESTDYDIAWDVRIVRYDVAVKGEQLFVGTMYNELFTLDDARKIAVAVLEKEMKARGVTWTDCVPLPLYDQSHQRIVSAHG